MKKKIAVEDLRPGMWVSELDRPWRETPFLFQGFEIRDDEEIEQIKRYCRHVYIDVTQEIELKARRAAAPTPTARISVVAEKEPTAREREFVILTKFAPGTPHVPHYPDRATLEQEMPRARAVERETKALVQTIMEDARLGRSLDTAAAKHAVSGMVDSILENPDALACLSQLKHKDQYTAEHSMRVCVLALAFGRHLELTPEELNILGLGALLHDVGKMKVPNEILNKPGALTPQEFEIMKSHVPRGVEILEHTQGIPPHAIEVARYHHERYNGTGYASGTRGEQIGLFGAIGAIVDCYDAITSDRAYHHGMSAFDALNRMYEWRQKDFHPGLMEQFIQCMGVYPIGSVVEMNTGSVGVVISVNRVRRLRPRVALVLTPDKTPYTPARTVDLMESTPETGARQLEIKRVLPAGTYSFNPTDYLPLASR